mgnify:CR=1 FL=1
MLLRGLHGYESPLSRIWEIELAEVEEEIKESARLDGRQVITFGEYAERHIEYNFTEEELARFREYLDRMTQNIAEMVEENTR